MDRLGNQFARALTPKLVVRVIFGLIGLAVGWGLIDHFQSVFYIKPFDLSNKYEALRQIKAHPRFCNRLFHGTARPIVAASYRGWPEAVEELLSQGADPNARDGFGYLAILLASQDSRPEGKEMVRMLLDAGADPYVSDPVYSDLMCSACGRCNVGVVALLLDRGWDPNRPERGTPDADTPLYNAYHSPYPGIDGTERLKTLKLLVEYGANVHQKIRGKSILEWIEEDEKSTIPNFQEAIVELQPEIRYLREVGLNQPRN